MRETILTWMTVQSSRQGHLPNPIHATSHDECMRPKARLTVELGEFQAKLPREPSPIEGTPSKTPRRTELKSRELQANDEEDRVQEDCNTQARCQLQALPVVQLVVLPRCCRWCRSRLRFLATPSRLVTARPAAVSQPASGQPPSPVPG